MEELGAHARYWRDTLILAAALLGAILLIGMVLIFGVESFNQYRFFRFPFGFYLIAQGLVLAIAAGGFWYARVQQRLDEELSESGEF
ncbi:sodium/substrate symporter small subunit [Methyloligella sp. 2.7D]|uniref:sodium/substrate symporter small subunit n=1 Tax=unclassified Methyloligella TaxID=2625955 RepID=UPI00157C9F3E|nr:sodium/substrate symporter small subunit [Methyloligella sp. GL2]QKP78477.1 DUF4212 domain-containing protein [Methyloligella sp. GL2]